MSHANAALTPRARLRVAQLVVDQHVPIAEVAARFQCSWPTVKRCVVALRAASCMVGEAPKADSGTGPGRRALPRAGPRLLASSRCHVSVVASPSRSGAMTPVSGSSAQPCQRGVTAPLPYERLQSRSSGTSCGPMVAAPFATASGQRL